MKNVRVKEGRLVFLCFILLVWLNPSPSQVAVSWTAAAFAEAATDGGFEVAASQLQAAEAFLTVTAVGFKAAAAMEGLITLVGMFWLLKMACAGLAGGFFHVVAGLSQVLYGILEGFFSSAPVVGALMGKFGMECLFGYIFKDDSGSVMCGLRQLASPGETDRSPVKALPAAAASLPVEQVQGFKRPGNEQPSPLAKFSSLFIRDLKGKTLLFQRNLGWDLDSTYLAVSLRITVP